MSSALSLMFGGDTTFIHHLRKEQEKSVEAATHQLGNPHPQWMGESSFQPHTSGAITPGQQALSLANPKGENIPLPIGRDTLGSWLIRAGASAEGEFLHAHSQKDE